MSFFSLIHSVSNLQVSLFLKIARTKTQVIIIPWKCMTDDHSPFGISRKWASDFFFDKRAHLFPEWSVKLIFCIIQCFKKFGFWCWCCKESFLKVYSPWFEVNLIIELWRTKLVGTIVFDMRWRYLNVKTLIHFVLLYFISFNPYKLMVSSK